jgi:hypothetical protein
MIAAAIMIITASNSFLTSSIVPNVSRSSIFCLTKILNNLTATLKKNLFTPLHPKMNERKSKKEEVKIREERWIDYLRRSEER